MKKNERKRYQTFVRVTEFGAARKELFPDDSIGGRAFATVAAALDTIDRLHASRHLAEAEARKVSASTRQAVLDYLRSIARTGRWVAAEMPGPNPFRLNGRRATTSLLATCRSFIEEAEKRQEAFVGRGLPATFLADFRALVDELDRATTIQLASRTARRAASAGMATAVAQGMDALRQLDAIVLNVLRLDPAGRAAWVGARRVDANTARPRIEAEDTGAPLTKAS